MMLQQGIIVVLLAVLFAGHVQGQFRRMLYPKGKQSVLRTNDDPGEPLFLTPYLEQGKVDEARRLR